MKRLVALGLVASIAAGCGSDSAPARAQWTVVISTDAAVPQFGDRLRVEVLGAGDEAACDDCARTFAVGTPDAWPVSFGVLPQGNRRLRVRARLYRDAVAGPDGLPDGVQLIDRTGVLPNVNEPFEVGLRLPMTCFGVPGDPETQVTCRPSLGSAEAELELGGLPQLSPGTWGDAADVPCFSQTSGAVPDDMACIEGGAFFLGSTEHYYAQHAPLPEQLTLISPFLLDRYEVSVGDVGELVDAGKVAAPAALDPACTYDTGDETLPINCVDRDSARAICQALGKRLPTEAEWEFAAGNRGSETTFPWGNRGEPCLRAVVGRGRFPGEGGTNRQEWFDCRTQPDGSVLDFGPVSVTAGDVTEQGIHHLGGNVAEFVDDEFAAYTDECWRSDDRVPRDPTCTAGSGQAIRGGSWATIAARTQVSYRARIGTEVGDPLVGVRCARSAP